MGGMHSIQTNLFISHANTYISQLQSFHLGNYLSEWCLGIAHVFPFLYGKVTTTIYPIIHYDNNYMCMVYSMYVMVAHLMSQHQTSSQKQLQYNMLFLDCCHQICKASHDATTP